MIFLQYFDVTCYHTPGSLYNSLIDIFTATLIVLTLLGMWHYTTCIRQPSLCCHHYLGLLVTNKSSGVTVSYSFEVFLEMLVTRWWFGNVPFKTRKKFRCNKLGLKLSVKAQLHWAGIGRLLMTGQKWKNCHFIYKAHYTIDNRFTLWLNCSLYPYKKQ